jgi:hypothetical protein
VRTKSSAASSIVFFLPRCLIIATSVLIKTTAGHRLRNLSVSQERSDVSRKRDAFDFVCLRHLSGHFTPPSNEKLGFQAGPIRQPSWNFF